MIAWGPGRIPAARTSDQVWAMWDVLPTLAELAGASAPAGIDGISMVPSLTGRGRQRQHDHLYWEFFEQGSKQAVRTGRWKGVRQPMLTGKVEVYDLETDVGETRDVSADIPRSPRGWHASWTRRTRPPRYGGRPPRDQTDRRVTVPIVSGPRSG